MHGCCFVVSLFLPWSDPGFDFLAFLAAVPAAALVPAPTTASRRFASLPVRCSLPPAGCVVLLGIKYGVFRSWQVLRSIRLHNRGDSITRFNMSARNMTCCRTNHALICGDYSRRGETIVHLSCRSGTQMYTHHTEYEVLWGIIHHILFHVNIHECRETGRAGGQQHIFLVHNIHANANKQPSSQRKF